MRKNIKDEIDRFHDYGIYLPTRTIDLSSEEAMEDSESGVDSAMYKKAVKNLHILDSLSNEPITVIINTFGGDKFHMRAVYDAIKECKSKVVAKVFGSAMSAGSIILQAADERIMMPSSTQMLHYGTWGHNDHSKIYRKWSEESLKVDSWMEKVYLERIREKHPDFTLAKVKKMLDFDTIISAEQSVKLGLADRVGETHD